jgi:predicted DNA-binding transcriptional regulator AlpA
LKTQTTTPTQVDQQASPRHSRRALREPISDQQADVALCDVRDIMAMTRMGKSYLFAAVRDGTFPAPVIRRPRCTRWSLAQIRAYLTQIAAGANASPTSNE